MYLEKWSFRSGQSVWLRMSVKRFQNIPISEYYLTDSVGFTLEIICKVTVWNQNFLISDPPPPHLCNFKWDFQCKTDRVCEGETLHFWCDLAEACVNLCVTEMEVFLLQITVCFHNSYLILILKRLDYFSVCLSSHCTIRFITYRVLMHLHHYNVKSPLFSMLGTGDGRGNTEKNVIGGSLELPMWLTDGFLVTFFGRWWGAVHIHVSHVQLPYTVHRTRWTHVWWWGQYMHTCVPTATVHGVLYTVNSRVVVGAIYAYMCTYSYRTWCTIHGVLTCGGGGNIRIHVYLQLPYMVYRTR